MPLPAENVCCRKSPCVTTLEFFQSAVLDMNVLSISIVNRSDVFADDPDYSPSGYRKLRIVSGFFGIMNTWEGPIDE